MHALKLLIASLLGALAVAQDSALELDARALKLATVYTSCTKPGLAALTFDDGPYIYETDVVDKLNAAGIKGTFFLNGNNWACIYDAANVKSIQNAYKSGHEFGNHTWRHRNLTSISWDTIHNEMFLTETALNRIIGVQPAMMRPPYGSYNNQVRQASALRNQSMVTWDFDSRDSDGATAAQSNALYDQLVKKAPKSVLALNHETYATTANTVLPHAISVLKNTKKYKFVTVSECLGIKPYQWTGKPQSRTSAWTC